MDSASLHSIEWRWRRSHRKNSAMTKYVVRRLATAVPVLVIGCALIFLVVFALPGDPVTAIGGSKTLPAATRAAIRAKYHLDQSTWRQLLRYLFSLLRGDLGESITTRRPVRSMLAEALPTTARITFIAVAMEAVLGGAAGIVATVTRRRFIDSLVTVSTVALVAMPTFVLGSVAQYFVGVRWRWLPVTGLNDGWRSYVLPCGALAASSIAYVARLMRVRLSDELAQPYVRTARAKGLPRRSVTRHAVRNALPVVVTFIGFDIATLFSGAIVTEIIFNLNGVGSTVARAISQRDQITIVGFAVLSLAIYVAAGIIVDVIVAALDPRIRLT
jgi:oligopeptide transport system permease protein